MTISRRHLIAGAGGVSVGALAGPTSAQATPAPTSSSLGPRAKFARMSWLGTTGWKIQTPSTTVLVDPYLSRFDTGLAAGRFDPLTPLSTDSAAIDHALGAAGTRAGAVDAILVTHTHWDHFADVPHIARTHGGTVFTTLTGYHLAQASDVPAKQVAVLRGAEELHVGDVVVRAVRSLHSRTGSGGLLFPGLHVQIPPRPETIADLPEGDTLAFLIRAPTGRSVLLMGASDFDDHALAGLSPDMVAMPVPSNDVTADYVSRLMEALDHPRLVVPVHWDDFESPLTNPPTTSAPMAARRDALANQIRRCSPRTKVLLPHYLDPRWLL